MAVPKVETLPRRRFIARGVSVDSLLGDLGFLSAQFVARTEGIVDLFDRRAVLVLAPPWTGKTFVTGQVLRHFSENVVDVSPEAPKAPSRSPQLEAATEFLLTGLAREPRRASVLMEEAGEAGVGRRTLQRAAQVRGVGRLKRGDGWWWSLPAREQDEADGDLPF